MCCSKIQAWTIKQVLSVLNQVIVRNKRILSVAIVWVDFDKIRYR